MTTEHVPIRKPWPDTARAIAIILVVLGHACTLVGVPEDGPIPGLVGWAQTLRLPLFFFVAGLFAAKWAERSWRDLANGKLRFLYWPLLIWSVPVFAYHLVGGLLAPRLYEDTTSTVLVRFVLSPVLSNAELWFLWALMLCFATLRLARRIPTWLLLPAAAAAAVLLAPHVPSAPGNFMTYAIYFLLAARLRDPVFSMLDRLRTLPAIPLAAVLGVVYSLLVAVRWQSEVLYVLTCVAGIAFGLVLAVALSRLSFLRKIGQSTLQIYVAHSTIIACIGFALVGVTWSPMLASAAPLVITAAALALTYALGRRFGETWVYVPPAWFRLGRKRRVTAYQSL